MQAVPYYLLRKMYAKWPPAVYCGIFIVLGLYILAAFWALGRVDGIVASFLPCAAIIIALRAGWLSIRRYRYTKTAEAYHTGEYLAAMDRVRLALEPRVEPRSIGHYCSKGGAAILFFAQTAAGDIVYRYAPATLGQATIPYTMYVMYRPWNTMLKFDGARPADKQAYLSEMAISKATSAKVGDLEKYLPTAAELKALRAEIIDATPVLKG